MERQSVKVSSLWSLCKLSCALSSTVRCAREGRRIPFDHVRLKERALGTARLGSARPGSARNRPGSAQLNLTRLGAAAVALGAH